MKKMFLQWYFYCESIARGSLAAYTAARYERVYTLYRTLPGETDSGVNQAIPEW